MNTKLSERKAKLHIAIIGIFYIISGFWELGIGATQAEGVGFGVHFLLDIYRSYLAMLGGVTILVGIVFLARFNIFRLAVIALAWWNLFTAPAIYIWWNIYAIAIKNFSAMNLSSSVVFSTVLMILIYTFIRIYIIYILKPSKAGYIFLNKGGKKKGNTY